MSALSRVGLWFISVLVAVVLFSLLLGSVGPLAGLLFPIFRLTAIFALPVWCLYLPVVIAVKNAKGWRLWTILFSGSLIGPFLLGLLGLVLELRGDKHEIIWYGDPLLGNLGGGVADMIFSLIVGVLTSSIYVVGLRVFGERRKTSGDRKLG